MSERSADWTEVTATGDTLFIPLNGGEVDHVWIEVFKRAVERWESEVRGQTWKKMLPSGSSGVSVMGVDAQTSKEALKAYLDEIVDYANRETPREHQRRADRLAAVDEEARVRAEADERLADRFRDPKP